MKKLLRFLSAVLAAAVMLTALPMSAFAAEVTVPVNEATKFVDSLGTIWNLGNAFDAANCTWLSNEMDYESGWCGAKTSKELIKAIKKVGFKTIRIPVSWHDHVDKDFNISGQWIDRVQEVVDWSLDEGLNVIINVHHDVAEGYYFPTAAHYNTSEKYMTAVWSQISEKFSSYDQRLIFEIINEPRVVGSNYEWWYPVNSPSDEVKESIDCVNRLNQVSLDTIRKSGGKNKNRYVLAGGYDTNVDGATVEGFKLPKDSVKNRLILDFHLYTRSQGTYKNVINKIYDKYVSQGIPAILSEFNLNEGANAYNDASVEFLSNWVSYARERGISCAIWDNNAKEYKLIDRATVAWTHEDIAKAIVKAGVPALGSATVSEEKDEEKTSGKLTVKASQSGFYATVKWNEIDGASKYKVYRATSKTGKKTLVKTTSSLKYTDKKTKLGKKYYYFVKSYDSSTKKWSGYSDSAVISIKKSTAAPTLKGTKSGTKMKLSWASVSGAEKYYVYYSVNGGEYKKVKTVDGDKKSYTVSGLNFTTNSYKFAVRAVDGDGNTTNRSNVITAKKK